MNDYYDPALKQARINDLSERFGDRFSFSRIDFAEHQALDASLGQVDIRELPISERKLASAIQSRTRVPMPSQTLLAI